MALDPASTNNNLKKKNLALDQASIFPPVLFEDSSDVTGELEWFIHDNKA